LGKPQRGWNVAKMLMENRDTVKIVKGEMESIFLTSWIFFIYVFAPPFLETKKHALEHHCFFVLLQFVWL
jgi:hypothetical protein